MIPIHQKQKRRKMNHFCLDMLIKGNLLCNIIIYLLHILKPLQRSVLALWIHRVSASWKGWDSIECMPMLVSGLSSKFLDLLNWNVSWIVFWLSIHRHTHTIPLLSKATKQYFRLQKIKWKFEISIALNK